MNIESAILAGGKNSRYGGQNKAFLLVGNKKIIDRNIEVLSPYFSRISIITNAPTQFSDYSNFDMNADYYHEIGPLAGIHSALKNTQADGVFISSCDMPFLDKLLIDTIIKTAETRKALIVIPRVGNRIEPLFAFYNRSILKQLEQHIEEGKERSIRSFLSKIDTIYMDFEDSKQIRLAFTNINRPSDLSKLGN